ncbi:MAG: sulfotransferase domain-containing protein [Pseudomonadota bacterium]
MNSLLDKNGRRLLLKSANRQAFNPTVIKHRQFDCHIATAKISGTHWLKYMLSLILAEIYNLEPPSHIIEDNIVGHTKTPPKYKHIPQIAVTHSHPHYLLRLPAIIDVLNLPKFMVVLRDPRDQLVSAYERFKGENLKKVLQVDYDVSFSEFLQKFSHHKKPMLDIWKILLFMNSWHGVLKTHPDNTTYLRYEDLKKQTALELKKACDFIGIEGATDAIIENAIENSARDKMREKLNPNDPGADKKVNLKERNFREWYSEDDKAFLNDIFDRYLKGNYGYDLKNWDEA